MTGRLSGPVMSAARLERVEDDDRNYSAGFSCVE